jgi:hypothetical protein
MLGTRIAYAAGYDLIMGAQFFAGEEFAHSKFGQLSFWGTHLADERRMALVIATMDEIPTSRAHSRKAGQCAQRSFGLEDPWR